MAKAPILVQGSTGFTGRLACDALRRRGIPFAVGGRSPDKLAALAREIGADETCVIDVGDAESVRAAVEGRVLVCACAGPFVQVGEPVLASCARLGVHYVDTTGEQRFVADAVARYQATAEAKGACIVPAFAFEIAVADWACALASQRLGGAPDDLAVVYMNQAVRGGYGGATSRGTKLSALGMMADADARQFVNGAVVREPVAAAVRAFASPKGKVVTAASFPSPESIVTPSHTRARTLRTFMAVGAGLARTLHVARAAIPPLVRVARPLLERRIARGQVGPDAEARAARFDVLAEATKGDRVERVFLSGSDPYGLTGEIQAYAAARAIAGEVKASGVVAPSVGYPPDDAVRALGLTIS